MKIMENKSMCKSPKLKDTALYQDQSDGPYFLMLKLYIYRF